MNLQHARDSYRRAARPEESLPGDPHAIIGVALAELQGALASLAHAAGAGLALPSGPMTRALSAIYLLQSSLDFEQGGEIAPALFRVYEFCRQEVLAAFSHEKGDAPAAAGLGKAADLVGGLAEAWRSMKRDPVPA